MIKKKLGDNLELNLQLWDGVISQPKRVFVELKDINGTLLKPTFEILHKSGGLYTENVETMPNLDIVFASFEVRNADGITKSDIHSIGQDVYMRDITGEIIGLNLDVAVSSLDKSAADLVGVIETLEISGNIETLEILGTIEQDNPIIGVVE